MPPRAVIKAPSSNAAPPPRGRLSDGAAWAVRWVAPAPQRHHRGRRSGARTGPSGAVRAGVADAHQPAAGRAARGTRAPARPPCGRLRRAPRAPMVGAQTGPTSAGGRAHRAATDAPRAPAARVAAPSCCRAPATHRAAARARRRQLRRCFAPGGDLPIRRPAPSICMYGERPPARGRPRHPRTSSSTGSARPPAAAARAVAVRRCAQIRVVRAGALHVARNAGTRSLQGPRGQLQRPLHRTKNASGEGATGRKTGPKKGRKLA